MTAEGLRTGTGAFSGSLQTYLSEIRRFPLLSRKEEHDIASLARKRADRAAEERLAVCNLKLVVKIALEYYGAGLEMLDLIQEGNMGLLRAVKKYDPDKGAKFSVYAAFWIRACILKYIMDSWSLVKVGNTRNERKLFYRLAGNPGLPATELGVGERQARAVRERLSQPDISLDTSTFSESLQFSGTVDGDSVEDVASCNEELRIVSDMLADFRSTLGIREALVFDLRIMAEEPASLRDTGSALGISHERVRQIERQVMVRLQATIEEKRLALQTPEPVSAENGLKRSSTKGEQPC